MSIEVLATYDERAVAQWVQNLSPKLAPFAGLFVEHQIEGPLFLRLTDEMLREMGINCAPAPRSCVILRYIPSLDLTCDRFSAFVTRSDRSARTAARGALTAEGSAAACEA